MKKSKPETIKAGVLFRAAEIGKIDDEGRTVELSFSSEEPVDRWFGVEILDHGKNSVVLDFINSGRAPLLADHDPSLQIGIVESAEIGADRKGRAVVRFGKSARADEYFQDVKDGIRGNISVGYRIHEMKLAETSDDDGDTYRVTHWEPLEISLVSIPADQTVGIGRAALAEEKDITIIRNRKSEDKIMPEDLDPTPAPAALKPVDTQRALDQIRKDELNRIDQITQLASMHNMQDAGRSFINDGKPVDEFRKHVLENLPKPKPIDTNLGLSETEARSFSFVRAIHAAFSRNWDGAPFEQEVIESTRKLMGNRKSRGDLVIPTDVLFAGANRGMQQRDLNVSSGPAGGYMVATNHIPGSFIELLRNSMVIRKLGARVMSGLEGNVSIPKQTGGASAYWVVEGADITESQQTIGQVTLSPKTVGAQTEYTRRMLLQSSPDVEQFVRGDLAKVVALKLDAAAINGSGAAGEPMGILNITGTGSVDISGGATWGDIVDLETEVATDNADVGSLAYLTNAAQRGVLKKAERAEGTAQFIWQDTNEKGVGIMNGYAAHASNQVPSGKIIFGNFSDIIIGEWGILELMVNPYAKDSSGGVRITALQDVDVAIRHPESFAVGA